MKIQMVNSKIAVVKSEKAASVAEGLLSVPNNSFEYGVVKFAFEGSKYKPGTKVFFGVKREPMRMGDTQVDVMDEDNVVAIVE